MLARTVLLLAALSIVPVACGDGDPAAGPGSPVGASTTAPASDLTLPEKEIVDRTSEAKVEIDSRDNSFTPEFVQVKAGTPITFDNRGRNEHNVYPTEADRFGAIETAAFQPGATRTITLDEPGDYRYYCTLHGTKTKGMVGGIRVVK